MNCFKYLALIVACLFSSCAVQHKTISGIRDWPYPQHQFDKQFGFSYFDDVLGHTNNKSAARWAQRKNIHVIGIRLVNNGDQPIHGIQLSFFNGDERAEIMHNKWLAKKVRQRVSPFTLLLVPVLLVEDALFHRNDDDEYQTPYDDAPYYITEKLAKQAEGQRKEANFNLRRELMDFQLAKQVLYPNEAIYGIIGIRCKGDLQNLKVVKNDVSFQVLSSPAKK